MKKIFACLFLLAAVSGFAQQSAPHAQQATNAIQSIRKAHPRLLLLKGEEQILVNQIKKHAEWGNVHAQILGECDKLLGLPPVERIKIGRRLLDKSRECLRRVFMLSYAYRTTKEDKYLKRAEKELLAVAAFEDWNPTHFLDVAEMTMAVAIGYDWLFDQLSAESRKIIKDAILKKGIEPSLDSKYNYFVTAEHNWNQVCNAGISFGALAIAEDEPALANQIIKRAVESVPRAMIKSYKPDGAYPEGFSYWGYGTSFNVLLISAMQKALGTDFGLSQSPGFLKTAGFLENLIGPTGMAHNWGDSGLREGLNPTLFWFAEKNKKPSLLWSQKKLLAGTSDEFLRNRIIPALLVWGVKTDLDAIKPPTKKVWVGQGPSPVAMMRTSWTDQNAIFVGFKAGSPAVNHAHMDVGSFVLDAQGERWAMDFGMQDYNSLEAKGVDLWNAAQNSQRWQVFRLNNFAHSTLIFNSQLQNAKGYAQIDTWSDQGDQLAAISDLSQVYENQVKSVKRGISIIQEKFVLVRDEIATLEKPVTMRWNLLTAANARIIDEKTVELSQNGKKMFLIFDTNAKINIQTWSTEPPHDYDTPNPNTQFIGFETTIPANSEASFNAYFSTSTDAPATKPLADWPGKLK
ncbi:heparinase II/III domain-containing protein [Dyadobacter fanqingshengii]|uniref:Heparinase II/III family protein n=1 Tax=Dyadobacter fanqingshengii TaxID=2906443 RepID=A0A9X1PCV8_9BACT|nr:heparinase II/III family protein [Dyadobacter fanqingshengii]MCF0041235.1 heparinase II/III family protein [Dyadobacter fanqingshengii]USJ37040.1 heparinase II/III family protein [Dyadobacter fanqingshengii]